MPIDKHSTMDSSGVSSGESELPYSSEDEEWVPSDRGPSRRPGLELELSSVSGSDVDTPPPRRSHRRRRKRQSRISYPPGSRDWRAHHGTATRDVEEDSDTEDDTYPDLPDERKAVAALMSLYYSNWA